MRNYIPIFYMLIASLLLLCTSSGEVSEGDGGGTKTGNPAVITATVVNEDGTPVPNCNVTIHSSDYLSSPDSLTEHKSDRFHMRTDENGIFSFSSADTGEFYIEANDDTANAVLMRCTIKNEDEYVNLGKNMIVPYSVIKGRVNTAPENTQSWIQVYGVERLANVDSNGEYIIPDIPEGTYSLRMINSSPSVKPIKYDSVTVQKGNTVSLLYADFKYSKDLHLNTTQSGANVNSTVYSFPLLIRLDSSNTDFTQFKGDGSDIRFSKADGSAVPFEIEEWDQVKKSAAIWVRIDTLKGNSDKQYIIMHWGCSALQNTSTLSGEVFDSSEDFLGVWHMNSSNNSSSYKTQDSSYGVTSKKGYIGNAGYFDGKSFMEINDRFNDRTSITLSAWVYLEKADSKGSDVISIGDALFIRMDDKTSFGTHGTYTADTLDSNGVASSKYENLNSFTFLENKGWHYIVYTISKIFGTQSLFIDGECVNAKFNIAPVSYKNAGKSTFIGTGGNEEENYFFTGYIDEVRICGTPRSIDWIRLCYMNQNHLNTLVSF